MAGSGGYLPQNSSFADLANTFDADEEEFPGEITTPSWMTTDHLGLAGGEDDGAGFENDELPELPELRGAEHGTKPASAGVCKCCSIAYYQPFFDVDTTEVKTRVLLALIPHKTADGDHFFQLVSDFPGLLLFYRSTLI
jgi:hypothetical protein